MAETIEETYESAVTRKVVRTNLKIEEVRIDTRQFYVTTPARHKYSRRARTPRRQRHAPAHITDNTFDSEHNVNTRSCSGANCARRGAAPSGRRLSFTNHQTLLS